MKSAYSYEMLVLIYQTAWPQIPEEYDVTCYY